MVVSGCVHVELPHVVTLTEAGTPTVAVVGTMSDTLPGMPPGSMSPRETLLAGADGE